jgi:hypothetical protein
MLLVLLIIFVVVMAVWALILTRSIQGNPSWLAFTAVLILGLVLFLYSFGVLAWRVQ